VSAWYARLCLSFKIHVVYSVCRIRLSPRLYAAVATGGGTGAGTNIFLRFARGFCGLRAGQDREHEDCAGCGERRAETNLVKKFI